MTTGYRVPVETLRTEIMVVNSRFVTTIARVETAAEAKSFWAGVRAEMPDASHHVYAFRVGFGNSVTEGMTDDGEPSGTAGPPVLAVLRGTQIGDVIVVVTRYFGGTKLGTGGLVRAYSDAARAGLAILRTEEKIEKRLLGVDIPYSLYEMIKRLITQHHGVITDETFASEVTILAQFPASEISAFTEALREMTAGSAAPVEFSDE
jgi:uncharacterized YigZ family protein